MKKSLLSLKEKGICIECQNLLQEYHVEPAKQFRLRQARRDLQMCLIQGTQARA
jgi:hypothetical protein